MSGVVAFEGELNSIVREYLEFSGFNYTLESFDEECTNKGKPAAQYDGKPKGNPHMMAVQAEILEMVITGNRKQFLRLWNEYLPESIRTQDTVAQKLEFYVNIYFAIYPLKYEKENAAEAMEHFRAYLETSGATLSQTTEFLPFYALPFVPNPKGHPSYKELFSERWVPDLRSRLEKFLTLALQTTSQPRLVELYKGGGGRDSRAAEQQLGESDRKANHFMKRYNRVQADYHNLISITADLVDSLEATVQGKPVSPEYLQQICMRLFSNQVRQSVDFTRPGTAGEVLRQAVVPPQGLQHSETTPGGTLDYDKIKQDMTSEDERTQGLLLQALRWKLTKSAPPERDAMLTAFIANDLLGCRYKGQHREDVLRLLQSRSGLVQQYTARLFNAFASLAEGRLYLAHNPDLLRSLMSALKGPHRDPVTRENVLGCLQKLSLRRQLQTLMIEEGIIAWLASELEDNDSLSDYMLEYSVALLMNLCLRTAGKRKCVEGAHKTLKVLSDLLGHENQEIIPYVNGTLYSILAIPDIREEARAMGMEEILRCFIKDGQPDMNRQIEFIVKQLNSNDEPEEQESDDEDEEEDEEDQDAMEADLDKAEMIKHQGGELSGERLLNTYYVSTAPGYGKKKRLIDGVVGQEEVLRRPVTPSQRRGAETPVVHVQPRSSRPPTGRPRTQGSRSGSRSDINRPPTRSGSRPGTQEDPPRPPSVQSDPTASDVISKATGSHKKLAMASDGRQPKPSQHALEKMGSDGPPVQEYSAAFGTRPKIPRTPDSGARPTSRGSIGEGPPPQPKYSDSLPTPRPGSGGRPTSSGKKTPSSPGPRTPSGGHRGKMR